jgi:hypothetical protein
VTTILQLIAHPAWMIQPVRLAKEQPWTDEEPVVMFRSQAAPTQYAACLKGSEGLVSARLNTSPITITAPTKTP